MNLSTKISFRTPWMPKILALGALVFLLGLALYFRVNQMLTTSEVLLYQREYDEGVYTASAQLLSQGYMPYRDFLFVEPPVALFLHAAILKLHPVEWGDATSFALIRYTTIAAGMITLVGVAMLAKDLGGWMSALLAVGLLTFDAVVIEIDRRAMLEPYVNALSVIALVCYVRGTHREQRGFWLFSAGFCAVLAMLVKTTGVLILGIIFLHLLWRALKPSGTAGGAKGSTELTQATKAKRHDLFILLAGISAAFVLVLSYFLITQPVEFVRQVYLFHLIRPPDGVLAVADRFNEILSNPGSHLTIYLAAGGIAVILLRGILKNDWGEWSLYILWIVGAIGIIVVARTFYLHYVLQVLVPSAILASALASHGKRDSNVSQSGRCVFFQRAAQIGIGIFFVLTNLTAGITQYQVVTEVPLLRSPIDLRPLRRFLVDNTPSNAIVFGIDPLYALTASRQPSGEQNNSYLIDTYGYLLYKSIGVDEGRIPSTVIPEALDVILGRRGQEQILGIAKRADYVVIDDRARNQLTPDNLAEILVNRPRIFESGQVSVYGLSILKP